MYANFAFQLKAFPGGRLGPPLKFFRLETTKILVGNKSHGFLIIIVLERVVCDCQQCYVLSCVIYDQIDLAPVYDDRGENFFFSSIFIRHWPQTLYQVGYYSLEKEELKWNNNNCKAVRAPVYHKAVRGYQFFFSYCLFNFFLLQMEIGGIAMHRMHASQ